MIKENCRKAYGETLVELGKTNPNIVTLDADLCKSTMGILFEQAYPERHFEMGIAEQNMLSTAAGLALTGKIPFAATFAVFISGRSYDQIRQTISIAKLNVKICGSSSGLSDFGDGSTHQAVEDMAVMRAIPNMTVLVPCDAVETRKIVRAAAAYDGPVYIRICRNDLPVITDESTPFEIGKPVVLREGKDIAIFAIGVMVAKALEAAQMLEKEGISAKVINVSSLKPLCRQTVIDLAKDVKGVVTAEEHSIIGGLGSAIAECLRMEGKKIEFIGVQDKFGTSAHNYDDLLNGYGLTAQAIADAAKKF